MTKTKNHGELGDDIERLVREYMSTIQVVARAAVERAVAAGVGGSADTNAKRRPSPSSVASSRGGKRRASDEVASLSERLYEALCRTPGETMMVLAPRIGAAARELHRPMTVLKRAGRIRSVGTRHTTRYFPMASRPSA